MEIQLQFLLKVLQISKVVLLSHLVDLYFYSLYLKRLITLPINVFGKSTFLNLFLIIYIFL